MKTDLFQSWSQCWVFQICWHIEFSTFTASSFRIWNSSTGIPPPPPALFVVVLPKAHLTLHSRMSGSRWVIIPLWLSGSCRSFLYSYSVYSCHLLLILKKEFIGPGLHLRSVHADHARPPLQWTLNSVFSVYGNDNRRIRPPPDRGILKIVSRLLIT